MKIIIKKEAGSNRWAYPGDINNFPNIGINPEDSSELIVINKSGKTIGELNQLVDYEIKTTTKKIHKVRGIDRRSGNDRRE